MTLKNCGELSTVPQFIYCFFAFYCNKDSWYVGHDTWLACQRSRVRFREETFFLARKNLRNLRTLTSESILEILAPMTSSKILGVFHDVKKLQAALCFCSLFQTRCNYFRFEFIDVQNFSYQSNLYNFLVLAQKPKLRKCSATIRGITVYKNTPKKSHLSCVFTKPLVCLLN